jgi:bacteriocin-like protein
MSRDQQKKEPKPSTKTDRAELTEDELKKISGGTGVSATGGGGGAGKVRTEGT